MLKASAMTLNCPDDLKRLDQWVGYKLVQRDRDSKPTKIPINPHTTGNADSTDPTTWGTFSDVVEAFRRHNFAGVGYVFTENDPHVGTDLDGCRNPQTGEIAPWAAQVIKVMDSYTEISPSGTGVHIITRGKKAGKACKRGQFEMYDRDRFFTMTGDHLAGTPTGIETRDAEIAQVYAEYLDGNVKARRVAPPPLGAGVSANDATLINKAAGARNGAKFSRLWDGDWSEYLSQSEADLALSSLLAFWTGGDRDRMDQLFRRSGLYRDKWEREDYRDGAIEKALQRQEYYHVGYRQHSGPRAWRVRGGHLKVEVRV